MSIMEHLKLKWPIIQAPMAGVTTPDMVAASANAGILGSIGAGYLNAVETRAFIRAVKEKTIKPFAVNLFVPSFEKTTEEELEIAYKALKPYRERLMISDEDALLSTTDFNGQIDVIIEEGVQVCSFTFGLPTEETIKRLQHHGIFTIGTATTVEEAIIVEKYGFDAVVIQGEEAGGHRGSFMNPVELVSIHNLLAKIKDTISIPIIAAGGIATKDQIQGAIEAGAQAVQIGTAFIVSKESGAAAIYKQKILEADEDVTALTKVFSGKLARGIKNDFMVSMAGKKIAPYPYQNDFTKNIRARAQKLNNYNLMAMWAGKNLFLVEEGTVKEIVERLTK